MPTLTLKRFIHRKLPWSLLVVALLLWPAFAVNARTPTISKVKSALTPLTISTTGPVDPLDQFMTWRRQNRITLPVTPPVWQAHLKWMRNQVAQSKSAPENSSLRTAASPPAAASASPGTNVDLAGGIQGYQGEVSIAVNPNNPSELVAGANTFYQDPTSACQAPSGTTDGTQALYGSTDGGASWTYNCAPWPSGDTGSAGRNAVFFGSDPTMAWDANGNAYAVYMLASQAGVFRPTDTSSIVIAKSSDSGATWSPLGVIVNNLSNSSVFDDKDMMAVDTTSGQAYSHLNRIYVIWDENNTERVAYSDNGTTWYTEVAEDVADQGSDIGGNLAVGPDGTVYAIWNRLPSSGDVIVFSKSTNGGASWSAPVQIASGSLSSFGSNNSPPAQDQRGINAFGSIAVDRDINSPYFGNIYVVYNDFPSGTSTGTNTNIYLVKSTDGGSTWSGPTKVNDDTGTATQFFPWVAVDQTTGIVVASWYDTRNDPNNKQTQIFLTESCDGGSTFAANTQVTQVSSQFDNQVAYSDENSTDNTNYNGNQYGDYSGLAAANGTAWPIWTDTRQYFPSSSGGNAADIEDAATSSVSIGSKPGAPTGTTAVTTGANQVTVSWTAGSPAGSSYNVYRTLGTCTSPGTFSLLASGVTSTSFVDSTVIASDTYSYEVTAVNSTSGCESAASICADVTVANNNVKPVPDGKWVSGTPMKATRANAAGTSIGLTWDVSTCQDPNYNVYYGSGSGLSTYTLTGSACTIGNSGSATWSAPAIPSGQKFIWWVIVGTDGVSTESSWGNDSSGTQRHPAASGECGMTAKSTATSCP